MTNPITFDQLKGKTLTEITGGVGDEELIFKCDENSQYRLVYYHECCASCSIEDICGDLEDLIGNPILVAEEVSQCGEHPEGVYEPAHTSESFTWTFYKLDTIKGGVTIRWFGTSNGYYSESVDFEKLTENGWSGYD